MITEIIVFGRGGQGAVTGAEIIAEAAFLNNYKDVVSFPSFGTERRGAPVEAYTRISSDEKIWTRSQIYDPDIVLILDEWVINKEKIANIKANGILVVNTEKTPEKIADEYDLSDDITIITCNITKISRENKLIVDGLPVFNTPILGALTVSLEYLSLESIKQAIEEHIKGEKGKLNAKVAEISANQARIRKGV
ncbi:MAG: 2-oxoacid:acceptor oxidoreductase family protein [Promethearchaeota archaeon]